MATTKSMRHFAANCLYLAYKAKDPSQRQMMVDVARRWSKTAEEMDRRVREGRAEVLPDLKNKLN
jgi:hypothetical protein